MNRDDFISIDAIRFGWNGLKNNLRFFSILAIIVAVLYNLPSLIATYFFKFQIPDDMPSSQDLLMLLPLVFVSMIIYLTVELGLLKIALNFRDDKTVEFEDLFRGYPLLIKYLAATIIFGLMIMLPFLLMIAASTFSDQGTTETIIFFIAFLILLMAVIYLYLKYQFYGYPIVDRGLGPIEALKQSGRLTEGVLKNLLLFWVELGLAIGVASAMVSIFVGIPVAVIFGLVSEDFVTASNEAENLVTLAIKLLIVVPLTKLSTADIYRRLEERSGAAVYRTIRR
jgi:hypothetical protein